MRRIINIVWDWVVLAVCIGVIIVGLSLLGGFVAHQYLDWKEHYKTITK